MATPITYMVSAISRQFPKNQDFINNQDKVHNIIGQKKLLYIKVFEIFEHAVIKQYKLLTKALGFFA